LRLKRSCFLAEHFTPLRFTFGHAHLHTCQASALCAPVSGISRNETGGDYLYRLDRRPEEFFLRVRPAFRAARCIPSEPLVRTAFIADPWRALGPRLLATARACVPKAACDAADRPSLFRAFVVARERRREGVPCLPPRPRFNSRSACARVFDDVVPFFGGGSFTPARLAFERPIAIACCGERAPCFPSRM
jgi:hypothetical protein